MIMSQKAKVHSTNPGTVTNFYFFRLPGFLGLHSRLIRASAFLKNGHLLKGDPSENALEIFLNQGTPP